MVSIQGLMIRPKKKNCYVALSRPTVKCEKTGSFFFFFFFFYVRFGQKNLLKFVFNGLKKHLHDLYMRFDCIPPEFSPFRNFKKNIGKLNSLTVRKKKKKKKSWPTDPMSGEGITIFFFGLNTLPIGISFILIFISTNISGPCCIKLTINGKLDFNGNYHRILDTDWLWCLVAMVVTIESKVTINGNQ